MRRKERPFIPVGSALRDAFVRLGMARQLSEQRALVVWPEVAGPQIAAATRPLRVRDGILFVATKSSAWAHELIFRKAALLQELAARVGESVVTDIRFGARGYEDRAARPTECPVVPPDPAEIGATEVDPASERAIHEVVSNIGDADLRNLIQQAMESSARVRRWQLEHGWRPCRGCQVPHAGAGAYCPMCRPRRNARW